MSEMDLGELMGGGAVMAYMVYYELLSYSFIMYDIRTCQGHL